MKYLKYFSFLLIALFPLKVEALISFNCNGPAKPNSEIACNITSDGNVSHFEATLGVDSKVMYFGVLPGSSFENKTSNKNLKFTSITGGTTITAVKIFIPASINSETTFNLNLTDIKYVFTTDGKERTQKDLSETVRIIIPTTTTTKKTTTTTQSGTQKTFTVTLDSNNGSNKKSSLSCSTTGSNCNIDLSKAETPTKVGASFAGWGNKVSCTSGSKTSYKADSDITLYACWSTSETTTSSTTTTTQNASPGGSLYLKALEIEGQEIAFSKFKFEYNLTVLYEIESLTIKAEPATEGINLEVGDSSALEVGDNKIIIKLADLSGNTSDYVLNVKRLKEGEIIKDLSSDATLKSVTLGKYSVNFSPTIVNYTIEIDSKTTSIPVTVETNDNNATNEIEGNTDLAEGSVIKITVTAEDGTTNTYNFYITVKKNFFEENKLYLGIAGALFLLLIILLIINNSKKKGTKVPSGASKAPTKKAPVTIQKSVPKSVPKPPSTNEDPKSKVEVLDI